MRRSEFEEANEPSRPCGWCCTPRGLDAAVLLGENHCGVKGKTRATMIRNSANAIRNWAEAQADRFGVVAAVVSLFVSLLITVVAVVVVGFFLPFSSVNRDVAVGDAFGAGIFLLAIVAAAVAVLAYVQSSRRPKLETKRWFRSLKDESLISESEFPRDPTSRKFTGRPPDGVASGPTYLVPLEPAVLRLRLENTGQVAAKNVAVLLRLEGIYFDPPPTPDPGSPWSFFPTPRGWKIQWQGGMDRPVYPNGPGRTPSFDLTGMWALSDIEHTGFGAIVTFADDLKKPKEDPLVINAAPSPAPAAP